MRDILINEKIADNSCLQCNNRVDWIHIIKYHEIDHLKAPQLSELKEKLLKIKHDANLEQIDLMIEDITLFLNDETPINTNQLIIRYNMLFRGYIIRNWFGMDSSNKYKDLNKVIVKLCI